MCSQDLRTGHSLAWFPENSYLPYKTQFRCPLEENALLVPFAPRVSHHPNLLSPPTVEPSLAPVSTTSALFPGGFSLRQISTASEQPRSGPRPTWQEVEALRVLVLFNS